MWLWIVVVVSCGCGLWVVGYVGYVCVRGVAEYPATINLFPLQQGLDHVCLESAATTLDDLAGGPEEESALAKGAETPLPWRTPWKPRAPR